MDISKLQVADFFKSYKDPIRFEELADELESEYWVENSLYHEVGKPATAEAVGVDYMHLSDILSELIAEGLIQKFELPVEELPGVVSNCAFYAAIDYDSN